MSTTPRFLRSLFALALAGACAGAAFAGPTTTYAEPGDAGDTVATAQVTYGAPLALSSIYGSMSAYTDVDLYLVNITSFADFSATTVNAGTSELLDTQLFLLTSTGNAVCLNDNDINDTTGFFRSTLGLGSCSGAAPGQYILGIASGLFDPIDANSQHLFQDDITGLAVRGANASAGALAGFEDNVFFTPNEGAYQIQLTGVEAAALPEPATALLVAGALVGCGWSSRRRQRATASTTAIAA